MNFGSTTMLKKKRKHYSWLLPSSSSSSSPSSSSSFSRTSGRHGRVNILNLSNINDVNSFKALSDYLSSLLRVVISMMFDVFFFSALLGRWVTCGLRVGGGVLSMSPTAQQVRYSSRYTCQLSFKGKNAFDA